MFGGRPVRRLHTATEMEPAQRIVKHSCQKSLLQGRAVKDAIWRAPAFARKGSRRHGRQPFQGRSGDEPYFLRLKPVGFDFDQNTEFVEDARCVGGNLQAGADFAKLRRLFENVATDTMAGERKARRQTCHPGSDDGGGLDGHGLADR